MLKENPQNLKEFKTKEWLEGNEAGLTQFSGRIDHLKVHQLIPHQQIINHNSTTTNKEKP